jgi:hypothetical protein
MADDTRHELISTENVEVRSMVWHMPQLWENCVENRGLVQLNLHAVTWDPAETRRLGQRALGGWGSSKERILLCDKHVCVVWLFRLAVPVATCRSAGSHTGLHLALWGLPPRQQTNKWTHCRKEPTNQLNKELTDYYWSFKASKITVYLSIQCWPNLR